MARHAFVLTCILLFLAAAPVMGDDCAGSFVKVPCRDMGDGRMLIDSLYLPDSFEFGTSRYEIIQSRPTSRQGEWANRICTIRINLR